VKAVTLGCCALASLFLLSGCATKPLIIDPANTAEVYDPEPVRVEHGIASYYDDHRTASGEKYVASAKTAAHRKLPFHTKVRVTNLRNGKTTIVRINDRGPYIKGRIIDLSLGAAREIDMMKAGIVKVKVEILKPIPVLAKPNLKYSQAPKAKPKPSPG